MQITFLLPGYFPHPIGGYRVVYEYADYLAARGHDVTVIYARGHRAPNEPASFLEPLQNLYWRLKTTIKHRPLVSWHKLNDRIQLRLVPVLSDEFVPDADASVATAWTTAAALAALSPSKGNKFYLIQHYEVWDGPEDKVNATWRLPLRKIVISKWLQALGKELGSTTEMRHIPNGIDLQKFHIITPPEKRKFSILSLYHTHKYKGVPDALATLTAYHERFPNVPISMFGASPRGSDMPEWITYHQNPNQEFLVRDLYNQNAVYFSTSVAEGWALPPAEAMACGCAFVGSDIGGFRDYSTNEDTALLSPPGDRDAFLRNLVRITEDPALLTNIQRRGTSNIQQFTWSAAGAAMEQYLKDAGASKTASTAA